MNLHEAIYSRRAVRDYTAEPIGREVLGRLVEAAVQAPSAVNEQPWSFQIVQSRELLARISREAKAHVLGAVSAGVPRHIVERLRDPGFDIFYNAPTLVVISSMTDSQWATVNCSLAAQNFMLAACEEGLGTCWIGFAQVWLGTPAGKAMLGVPAHYVPIAPIILGRPVAIPAAVARKEPEVRWIGP